MHHRTTPAIIVRTRPLREADQLVTCLTEAAGKLVGVAPNARRSQRRFGGALEPGTVGEVAYVERGERDLVRIESVRVEWSPLACRHQLEAVAACGVLLEVADATTVERQEGQAKFALLREALQRAADAPLATTVQSLVRWLGVIGFQPNLEHCVRCGQAIGPATHGWFLPGEGGAACDRCGRDRRDRIALTPAGRAGWSRLAGTAWVTAGDGTWAGCRPLLQEGPWQSICHAIGRPLKSRRYWDLLWESANAS